MPSYIPVSGNIFSIEPFLTSTNEQTTCTMIIGVRNTAQEETYFIIDQHTYIVDHITLRQGNFITAYYDAMLPVPLIYPPQYRAVVIIHYVRRYFIKVDYFNNELISSDNQLKLNITPRTQILLPNDQTYFGKLTNQSLIVFYRNTTRSIPAVTTPYRVIVLCLNA